jgi:hypothetical protein
MSSISAENTPFKKPKIFNIPKKSNFENLEQLKTIQNLTQENSELKEALADLEKDLKEKDQSIEESRKIINKLKDEYSKVIKEFELMEKSYNELLDELNQKTIEISEAKKTQSMMNVLINKNKPELSIDDKKLLYKQNLINKKKILSCGNIKQKNEKSKLKDMNEIIGELKNKNLIYIKIIKEKDSIIEKQIIKIKELSDFINKLNEKNKISENNYENIFDKKNASLSLVNLLNDNENISDNLKDKIPEEISINMNLKNDLIKSELFSSLIREYHFKNFLKKIFDKINISKLIHIYQYSIENKNNYISIIKENHLLKKTNRILFKNLLELKEQININNKIVKTKCINLIENINTNSNISNKIKKINEIKIKNKNSNIFNNRELFKIKENTINSQRVLNTLPNFEENNFNEFKMDKTNIIQNDSINNYKKINNNLINTSSNRYKKRILKCKNIEADIILKNNSLEFDTNKIEGNLMQDKFNSTNVSLLNNKNSKNNANKNNIFKLHKEYNNIISKSVAQSNINDPQDEIPKNNINFFKISNANISKKNLPKKNQNEIIQKEKENKNIKIETKKNLILHNTFFTCDFFINMIYKTNEGIFMKEELDKYNQIYNLTSYENIYLTFKKTCNELKIMTDEMNLKINKSHNINSSNILNEPKIDYDDKQKDILDGSFKVFNERILKLKKLEFEFINMNEYIKSYLISQETTIRLMYKEGKRNVKFEPIDKLFNLFEDCLSYRINEMNENIKFNRKLLIKLFKNQINCLFLSFEYKFK